ncbi:MAG: hypothetical protein ACO33A_04015 [Hyphomonas sp.]
MQVGQKKTGQAGSEGAAARPAHIRDAASVAGRRPFSPARALQARLARELTRRTGSWSWHSLGLLVTVLVAAWLAAAFLNAGLNTGL